MDQSFLSGINATFLEEQLKRYKQNPQSVPKTVAQFFHDSGESQNIHDKPDWNHPINQNGLNGNNLSQRNTARKETNLVDAIAQHAQKNNIDADKAARDSIRALMLIRSYRVRGHLIAELDPLGLRHKKMLDELKAETYGFSETDRKRPIYIHNIFGKTHANIDDISDILKKTYCGNFAIEYIHITNAVEKTWLQNQVEPPAEFMTFTEKGKKAILQKLIEAECFEKMLAKKYIGTKRFGLDGAESLLTALEQVIKRGGALGVKEIIFGMSHRGRLNVLCNVMNKSPEVIFYEFKGGDSQPEEVEGSGDVKYHMGYSSDRQFDGNKVHLSLCSNPSHLEAVNPVALGKCRAKQDAYNDTVKRVSALPLLIHGDAAFAGQGVTAECFGLSDLKGHRTGGSVHFIVNNQIGFTTNPLLSRSSAYSSDVAKIVEAPIFHVNGDNPEAVVFAARLATEYRQRFAKPVIIDIFCYRRFGHNEGDEPMFTQPLMYKKIAKHPTTLQIYSDKLQEQKVIDKNQFENMKQQYLDNLEESYQKSENYKPQTADWLEGKWADVKIAKKEGPRRGITAFDSEKLQVIARKINTIPQDFNAHKTIRRIYQKRMDSITKKTDIDWASAEALAFASIMDDGFGVRLSGQDCERGTFSQRHSVLIDQQNEKKYIPIENFDNNKKTLEVVNSMLSEEAVLGFEYGYSIAEPNVLTLWEAQFGDFANGAQVIIDQFISSSERKWLRMSGLVMLLPHGYEGQGPEHSSARLERYLQLCAQDNIQVANCTTPSNYFHILRRQLCRDFRKPLILMTPKSLLRHKKAVSTWQEFTGKSTFHRILWDDAEIKKIGFGKIKPAKDIKKIVLCSGKVYYDLVHEREKRKVDDIYFMRIEQLYPFPSVALTEELQRFQDVKIIWCQEEPKNMGAWSFVMPLLADIMKKTDKKQLLPIYAGRSELASTAAGIITKHQKEIDQFMSEVFDE